MAFTNTTFFLRYNRLQVIQSNSNLKAA